MLVAIEDKKVDKALELMTTLGEQATDAAEIAEGKETTKIKAFGKALTYSAKAISKFM